MIFYMRVAHIILFQHSCVHLHTRPTLCSGVEKLQFYCFIAQKKKKKIRMHTFECLKSRAQWPTKHGNEQIAVLPLVSNDRC